MIPPVFAVVPVKDHWADYTEPLLTQLAFENVVSTLVVDNGSTDETLDRLVCASEEPWGKNLHWLSRRGASIYAIWNEAALGALEESVQWSWKHDIPVDDVFLAVLNNDLRLPAGVIDELARGLNESGLWAVSATAGAEPGLASLDVVPVTGTYRHRGLLGACFVMSLRRCWSSTESFFDPEYRWWYGDDDFVRRIEQRGGKVGRMPGVIVDHVNEGTANDGNNEWTHLAKEADRRRFEQKWGEGAA